MSKKERENSTLKTSRMLLAKVKKRMSLLVKDKSSVDKLFRNKILRRECSCPGLKTQISS